MAKVKKQVSKQKKKLIGKVGTGIERLKKFDLKSFRNKNKNEANNTNITNETTEKNGNLKNRSISTSSNGGRKLFFEDNRFDNNNSLFDCWDFSCYEEDLNKNLSLNNNNLDSSASPDNNSERGSYSRNRESSISSSSGKLDQSVLPLINGGKEFNFDDLISSISNNGSGSTSSNSNASSSTGLPENFNLREQIGRYKDKFLTCSFPNNSQEFIESSSKNNQSTTTLSTNQSNNYLSASFSYNGENSNSSFLLIGSNGTLSSVNPSSNNSSSVNLYSSNSSFVNIDNSNNSNTTNNSQTFNIPLIPSLFAECITHKDGTMSFVKLKKVNGQ